MTADPVTTIDVPSDVAVAATLAEMEAIIERGLSTFVDVGRALLTIRNKKLYRATHLTFQDYCLSRWGMSRPRAYEVMAVAEISAQMSGMPDIAPLANARQMSALAPIKDDPEAIRKVVTTVREEHGDAATAADVHAVVAREIGRPSPKAAKGRHPRREADSQDIPDDVVTAGADLPAEHEFPFNNESPCMDDGAAVDDEVSQDRYHKGGAICGECRERIVGEHRCETEAEAAPTGRAVEAEVVAPPRTDQRPAWQPVIPPVEPVPARRSVNLRTGSEMVTHPNTVDGYCNAMETYLSADERDEVLRRMIAERRQDARRAGLPEPTFAGVAS